MAGIAGYYDLQLKRWVDDLNPASRDLPRAGQTAPVAFGAAAAAEQPPGPQSGLYIKHIPVVLAKVNTSGTQRLTASVAARIDNPSARLICGFSISFEPSTPQPFSNYVSAAWSATGMRPRRDGREARLHSIFASRALPELWEISSSTRGILVEATVTVPLTAGAAAIEGNWVLVAEWEPALPMCEDEVRALYSYCVARQVLEAAGPLAP